MAYDSGFLDERIQVLNPSAPTISEHGVKEKGVFHVDCTAWANVSYVKGKRALNNGSIEAYDVYIVRCRYNRHVQPYSHIKWRDKEFQIDGTPKGDQKTDETQFNMIEIVK